MENLVNLKYFESIFKGKKVFLTGHTGFKGTGMLCLMHLLGAEVKGFSLAPEQPLEEHNLLSVCDPFSVNKVASEIRMASYRSSYFNTRLYNQPKKSIASARAGHVIGKYLPGTRIAVKPIDDIALFKPDYIVIFPWNLKEEISDQLAYTREWNAKLVLTLPELEIF